MAATARKELAIGVVDGANATFSTANDYVAGTVVPILNGLAVPSSLTTEVPPRSFALDFPPIAGDVLAVYYVRL